MQRPALSTMTTQRIDRLLRSLVGVADVRMLWRAHSLRAVHIFRADGTQPHQLIRNIVSGLQAGFGIQLTPAQVHIHEDRAVFDAIEVAAAVLSADDGSGDDAAGPANAGTNGHANGHSNGASKKVNRAGRPANGSGAGNGHASNGAAPARKPVRAAKRDAREDSVIVRPPPKPAVSAADAVALAEGLLKERQQPADTVGLTLERIDVEHRAGTLRCRTVLALGDNQYSAIAEVPDSPSAEAELAARVAVDALRAGGLTTAQLEGVGFITIAKTNYCVATVREPGNPTPRASAAPLIDSMAASATAAVLTALGSFTDVRAIKRARAGH